jgi:hypothetical protein
MQPSLLDRISSVTGNRSKRHAKFRLGRLQQPPTESTTRLAISDGAQAIDETKSPRQPEPGATQCKSEESSDDNAGGPQPMPAPDEGDTPTLDDLQQGPSPSGSGIVSGWKLAAVLIALSLAVFCMALVCPGSDHILRRYDVP